MPVVHPTPSDWIGAQCRQIARSSLERLGTAAIASTTRPGLQERRRLLPERRHVALQPAKQSSGIGKLARANGDAPLRWQRSEEPLHRRAVLNQLLLERAARLLVRAQGLQRLQKGRQLAHVEHDTPR